MNNECSKWKKLNNGLPQGSVLAPLLFNIYISDMPETKSKKFGYADDLALAIEVDSYEEGETILEEDVKILFDYYSSWRLNPNPSKTEVSIFHLNNKLANKIPKVRFNDVLFQYNPNPKYLGVYLDRSLTFSHHLQKTSAKIRTRR